MRFLTLTLRLIHWLFLRPLVAFCDLLLQGVVAVAAGVVVYGVFFVLLVAYVTEPELEWRLNAVGFFAAVCTAARAGRSFENAALPKPKQRKAGK
jgi:hypothetical protein